MFAHFFRQVIATRISEIAMSGSSKESLRGVIRGAARLFNQQMWCWGQDVKRADNLLLGFGFEAWHPPIGTMSTGYALTRGGHQHVVLWGFGLFHGDPELGGMFVRRFGFAPLLTEAHDLPAAFWKPEQMPRFRLATEAPERDRLVLLLRTSCRWVAEYEDWVHRTHGEGYRNDCVMRWQDAFLDADRMAQAWRRLADSAEDVVAVTAEESPHLASSRAFPQDRVDPSKDPGSHERQNARQYDAGT